MSYVCKTVQCYIHNRNMYVCVCIKFIAIVAVEVF